MADGPDIEIDVSSALWLGARTRQEDAVATAFSQGSDVGFSVLSDGMGGHAAGDLASRIIVTEIFSELTLRSTGTDFGDSDIPALLRYSVDVANTCLRGHVEANPATRGMGGTVIATVVVGARVWWISVGDSVLYLYRDGELSRLNEDHSMGPQIDMMAEQGLIDFEAARNHPQRNCLTSALIGEDISAVDCPRDPFTLREGDILVVASDGLQFMSDKKIADLLGHHMRRDSRQIAEALIEGVAEEGDPEQDNTSIVVMKAMPARVRAQEQAPSSRPVSATDVFRAAARAITPGRHASSRS